MRIIQKRNQYKLIKAKEKRKKFGVDTDINKYMNIVFTGEIGSGKKTVASILSEMFYSMGFVKSKSIVEIDKDEIISVMNKDIEIDDILNKFLGKVLFIDKAHLILKENKCSEIISSLIKFIDKSNNKTIVVLSGEKHYMRELLLTNPSLNYRFPTYLDFENYNENELFNIALNTLNNKGFSLEKEEEEVLNQVIQDMYEKQNLGLKNGLMIKQFLDNLIRAQSIRVCDEKVSHKDINLIKVNDILISKKEFLRKNIFKSSEDSLKITDREVNLNKESKTKEKNYDFAIIDELIKLKNLLDLNVINQEEFNILKRKLIK